MASPISLTERLRASLRASIAARDHATVSALRSALSAIDNAHAVAGAGTHVISPGSRLQASFGVGTTEVARRELSEDELKAIVDREISDRMSAADEFDRLGRPEDAATLREEAGILLRHLDGSP